MFVNFVVCEVCVNMDGHSSNANKQVSSKQIQINITEPEFYEKTADVRLSLTCSL